MAKKQPIAELKVLVTGGQANPAPPLGPVLSQHRVNSGQLISQFNERTRDQMGVPLPCMVQVYRDGSFDFEVKTPAAGVVKGSGEAKHEMAGSITTDQLREIAEEKMEDLNAASTEAAMRVIAGTARSCGIKVEDEG